MSVTRDDTVTSRRTAVRVLGGVVAGTGVVGLTGSAAATDSFEMLTLDPSGITDTTARFEAKIESLPDGEKATHYFEWGVEGAGLPNTTDVDGPRGVDEDDTVTEWMFSLDPATTYELRAVGETTISETVDSGDVVTFTTDRN